MKNSFLKTYPVEMKMISPVHIGTGETVSPYEYILSEINDDCFIKILDLPKLLRSINPDQRKQLLEATNACDTRKMHELIQSVPEVQNCISRTVQVIQPAVYKDIQESISNPNRTNQIHPITCNPAAGTPYIPGSSIKGAIRTAFIDGLLQDASENKALISAIPRNSNRTFRQVEAYALGNLEDQKPSITRDPLRQLSICDAHLETNSTYIDEVVIVRESNNKKRKHSNSEKGIRIFREVTWSLLDEEDCVANFEIRLHTKLSVTQSKSKPAVSRPVDIQSVIKACNDYFRPKLLHQSEKFCSNEVQHTVSDIANSLAPNQCIIRLGRHSHYECVTFTDPYNHKPRNGAGATRSHIGGDYPLGWAVLTFPSFKKDTPQAGQ